MKQSILRFKDVLERTGLSRATIYAQMKSGLFPQSFKLGLRAAGWHEADVQSWINSRQSSKAV